ncbi:Uncharacterised protein [Candidatus Venteria ishoeyi]|uniref:Uncharacterized protein n=2 Tax=Candidatus Venteria ishoeyi TaxID=1899563 RepID=A0A1H6F5K0_9GAMM|nr:Uncharacterised protein [Candidatus Venteria ishoeyi]
MDTINGREAGGIYPDFTIDGDKITETQFQQWMNGELNEKEFYVALASDATTISNDNYYFLLKLQDNKFLSFPSDFALTMRGVQKAFKPFRVY